MIERVENPYTPEWFKQRAFNSLQKIEDGVWDYSDSLLLYTPGTETEYESIQQGEDEYSKLVTTPERKFLKDISEQIVAELPQSFEYIDLGPGTAHKEQFIFDAAKTQGKNFRYSPVDISPYYLKLATEYASAQGLQVNPVQVSFEELAEKEQQSQTPRFISLGLTFTNYDPNKIMELLKRIAGDGGHIFIDVQDRTQVAMEKIVSAYNKDVRGLVDLKLKLIGVDPAKDISEFVTDDGIRIWCTLKNTIPSLEEKGVKAGDKLLMFQSLRYTKESFEKELKENGSPYTLFDMGNGFIGALIKN